MGALPPPVARRGRALPRRPPAQGVHRAPDQALLASPADSGAGHQRAARARDGSYAFAYTPLGRPLTVTLAALRGPAVRAAWFDPRAGVTTAAGTFPASGVRAFDPPGGEGRGRDWVLVLDGGTPSTRQNGRGSGR